MEYNELRKLIDGISDAISKGNYKVSYEEPNNISECFAPDGRKFYKITDQDGARSSNEFGSCTVEVMGYTFTCNWETAEVESDFFDEFDDSYELPDGSTLSYDELKEDVLESFEDRDDIFFGEYISPEDQMEVFGMINHIEDPEYYYSEDEDCPVDTEEEVLTYPEDLDYGTVTYKGVEYYIVDEPEQEDEEYLHAVKCDEEPDDQGNYSTVYFTITYDEDGNMTVTDCEETDDMYDAIEGYVTL